jgi:hypothetical protein
MDQMAKNWNCQSSIGDVFQIELQQDRETVHGTHGESTYGLQQIGILRQLVVTVSLKEFKHNLWTGRQDN